MADDMRGKMPKQSPLMRRVRQTDVFLCSAANLGVPYTLWVDGVILGNLAGARRSAQCRPVAQY